MRNDLVDPELFQTSFCMSATHYELSNLQRKSFSEIQRNGNAQPARRKQTCITTHYQCAKKHNIMHLDIGIQYGRDNFLHHCSSEQVFLVVLATEYIRNSTACMIRNLFSVEFFVQDTLFEYCFIDVWRGSSC